MEQSNGTIQHARHVCSKPLARVVPSISILWFKAKTDWNIKCGYVRSGGQAVYPQGGSVGEDKGASDDHPPVPGTPCPSPPPPRPLAVFDFQ